MLELHESDGVENIGTIKWELALCLLAVYLICYFSLWKGISTSGKVSKLENVRTHIKHPFRMPDIVYLGKWFVRKGSVSLTWSNNKCKLL